MRILYINPSATLGGAERSLLDILSAIREISPELDLHLIVTSEGALIEKASKLGVTVHLLPLPTELAELGDSGLNFKEKLGFASLLLRFTHSGILLLRYTQKLRKLIREIQPDIVHSNGFKSHILSSISSYKIPLIWHIRDLVSSRGIVRRALKLVSRKATLAIAISKAVEKDLQTVFSKLPIEIVYNAIDTDVFYPRETEGYYLDILAGSTPAPKEAIRIGLVATFARWKGQDLFLKAATHVLEQQKNIPVQFYIIGGQIYQTKGSQFSLQELEDLAFSLDISKSVTFIDFQENTADVYRSLDIVVHASTQPEPFGRTIIEAMACGKPVIVSQAGGAAELFTHDFDAVGVPPNDSEALSLAMKELIDSPEKRQSLGKNARKTVVERFNQERLGKEILALYEELSKI